MHGESEPKQQKQLRCTIGGLQPIPRDPEHNGVAAMLDDRTFCFVIQHGRHTFVFLDPQGLVANHLCVGYAPVMPRVLQLQSSEHNRPTSHFRSCFVVLAQIQRRICMRPCM